MKSSRSYVTGRSLHGWCWAGVLSCLLVVMLAMSLALPAGAARAAGALPRKIADALAELPGTPRDQKHRMGLKPTPPGDYLELEVPEGEGSSPMPAGTPVDLSGQLPPVGDQGQQGSCVGWATSYYYKTWVEKQEHTGWDIAGNPQYRFSPAFVYNQINGGQDRGAYFQDAFTLLQTKGDVDIADFPYSQSNYTRQPTTAQLNAAKPYRAPSGWGSFWRQEDLGPYPTPNPIEDVKTWLADEKILVMGIPVYTDFPNYGSSPARAYYDYNGSAGIAGGHAVCVSGYNDNINPGGADADHRGGFKMVNSWGADWNGANAGFVYLSYDFVKRYVWEAWSMADLEPDTPGLTSLSRSTGPVGSSVTLAGGNFGAKRRNASVKFNGVVATTTGWTNESVMALVPPGATSGPVVVCDWEGAASNSRNFTVDGQGGDAPTVSSIDPGQGESGSQVAVSVSGSNFADGCQVKLVCSGEDDIEASGENLVSAGQVDCNLGLTGAKAGAWDVVVTNTDERSGVMSGGFTVTGSANGDTYEPNDGIEEAFGPVDPGTVYESFISTQSDQDYYKIEVPAGCEWFFASLSSIPSGADYDFELYNSQGALVNGSWNWNNSDEVVYEVTPAPGTYYLAVYPYNGYSSTDSYNLVLEMEIADGAPVINQRSPSRGRVGTLVTIRGTGFGEVQGNSYVTFGSCQAVAYTSWTDTEIKVKVPSAAARRVALKVIATGVESNGQWFWVTPRISDMTPASGGVGAVVTISGNAFGGRRHDSSVVFGSKRVRSYVSWSNSEIRVKVPAGVSGQVKVKVLTTGGVSNFGLFSVTPRISKRSPSSGGAGDVVTIRGTAFGSRRRNAYVAFGSKKVRSYMSWSNGEIKARVPAGVSGHVKVRVNTNGGRSNPTHYECP